MKFSLFALLLDLLFPPKCTFCCKLLATGELYFCGKCQATLPWLTGAEAEQTGEFFALSASPLRYENTVRDSLRRYKFHGRQGYHSAYSVLLTQCISDHLAGQYDLISWVPLSDQRRRERGYDQAQLLATAVAAALNTASAATLCKPRNTPAQSGLDQTAARRANVLGAYQPLDSARITGTRILLIDDIITSGATMSECARVLRTAGATAVVCATVARAR